MPSPDQLRAVFEPPELAWLLDRLVTRLQQGKPVERGAVTLAEPSDTERRAIDDLLGRRSTRGKSLTADLAQLTRQLHLTCDELESLVISLRGPVENRREARARQARAWTSLFSRWQDRLASQGDMLSWIDGLRRTGLLKRLAGRDIERAESLLEQAWAILEPAPHDDILLATLAARITGDSHALDRGQPLSNLCLRAIAERFGINGGVDADARREAWAAAGVVVDDLSAPALCLNLRPAPNARPLRGSTGISGMVSPISYPGDRRAISWPLRIPTASSSAKTPPSSARRPIVSAPIPIR